MRLKIALRNLIISQIVILLFLVFAYLMWFPHSFSQLGGFTKTALLLIIVDLVLGPLLVYIVFKEGKRHLKFDINVLLGIQIIAFLFGAHSLFLKHPAYAVFTVDRFTLINVSQIYPQQSLIEQIKASFFTATKLVVAKAPTDRISSNKLLLGVILNGEPDIDTRPELYNSFNSNIDNVFSKTLNAELVFLNQESQEKLTTFLHKNGGIINDYAFFPLKGNNRKDVIWAFSHETKLPVGIIDSDPWVTASDKLVNSGNQIKR